MVDQQRSTNGAKGVEGWASKCGSKKTSSGKPCALTAGHGTTHPGYGRCKHHGGATPAGQIAAHRQEAEAMVLEFAQHRDIDPDEALLEEVRRTAGIVHWLQNHIAEQVDQNGPSALTQRNLMSGKREESVWMAMYQKERQHLQRASSAAIAAGVATRRVELAESQAATIAAVIRGILADLGVQDDPRAPQIVRRHLLAAPGATETIDVQEIA